MKYNIHNVRFFFFKPEAIHCLAYEEKENLLALSRADGSIEIWDCAAKPFKRQTIIGQKGSSVEALLWVGSRLFSAGLNAFIIEYDVNTLLIQNQISATGGPIWCMALSPNNNLLAVGTEDGFLCIFNVVGDGLIYEKTLNKQENRILSLGWHSDSEHIVTGSINFVQFLSIETEKAVRFPVGKLKPSTETIIWCVAALDDKTIVTGDSRGKTCVWDGKFGTLISEFQTHQADVLSMQISPDQRSLYVAGVDPVIVELRYIYSKAQKGRSKFWVKSAHSRRIHTHDVRALALTKEGNLFSGGVDTYLALSYYESSTKTVIRYAPTPPGGRIAVARNSNCLLLSYDKRLELWKLGKGANLNALNERFLSLTQDPVKLCKIDLKENDRIEYCDISPNANRIAVVVNSRVKVYAFTHPHPVSKSGGKINRIKLIDDIDAISHVLWLDENRLCVALKTEVQLQIFSIDENVLEFDQSLTIPTEKLGGVKFLTSSIDKSIGTCDLDNIVYVFPCLDGAYDSCVQLPKSRFSISALGIHNNSAFLALSNMTLSVYDISTGVPLSNHISKELMNNPIAEILRSNKPVSNISFDEGDRVYLQNASKIFAVDFNYVDNYVEEVKRNSKASRVKNNFRECSSFSSKNSNLSFSSNSSSSKNGSPNSINDKFERFKVPKTPEESLKVNNSISCSALSDTTSNDSWPNSVRTTVVEGRKVSVVEKSNHHVMSFSHMKLNEGVSVEISEIGLLDSLPPALKTNKFGAR